MTKATGVEIPIRTSIIDCVVYLWKLNTTVQQQVIIVEILMVEEYLILARRN